VVVSDTRYALQGFDGRRFKFENSEKYNQRGRVPYRDSADASVSISEHIVVPVSIIGFYICVKQLKGQQTKSHFEYNYSAGMLLV
jgi:hypothetical protein